MARYTPRPTSRNVQLASIRLGLALRLHLYFALADWPLRTEVGELHGYPRMVGGTDLDLQVSTWS